MQKTQNSEPMKKPLFRDGKTVFHQRDRTPDSIFLNPDHAGIRCRNETVLGKVIFVLMDFSITMKGRVL